MSCRALVERCNGLLKMQFCCLLKHSVVHYGLYTTSMQNYKRLCCFAQYMHRK